MRGGADREGGWSGRDDVASGRSEPDGAKSRFEKAWQSDGAGGYVARGQPFKARIARDGRIRFEDNPTAKVDGLLRLPIGKRGIPLPILTGSFDVTDMAMKASGQTLYPYRKHKLMEESRGIREEMAQADRSRRLQQSQDTTWSLLRAIWTDERFSAQRRRYEIFRIWDECAETGAPEVLAASREVRNRILHFIRFTLPHGSAQAYSSAELGRLNAQRSSERPFRPYTDASD